jgi:hypothetical protein
MSDALYGIVTNEVSDRPGWYRVMPSVAESFVVGTSILKTVLIPGQRVAIIQAWDRGRAEYGFIEAAAGYESLLHLDAQRSAALDQAPASCAMYRLLQAAGAKRDKYRPGVVTALGSGTLTVLDRFRGKTGTHPIAPGVDASLFFVDDNVLVREVEGEGAQVIGWWQVGSHYGVRTESVILINAYIGLLSSGYAAIRPFIQVSMTNPATAIDAEVLNTTIGKLTFVPGPPAHWEITAPSTTVSMTWRKASLLKYQGNSAWLARIAGSTPSNFFPGIPYVIYTPDADISGLLPSRGWQIPAGSVIVEQADLNPSPPAAACQYKVSGGAIRRLTA